MASRLICVPPSPHLDRVTRTPAVPQAVLQHRLCLCTSVQKTRIPSWESCSSLSFTQFRALQAKSLEAIDGGQARFGCKGQGHDPKPLTTLLRLRAQVANTSRRARELWSIVNDRLVAMIRVRNAIAS